MSEEIRRKKKSKKGKGKGKGKGETDSFSQSRKQLLTYVRSNMLIHISTRRLFSPSFS